MRVIAAVLLSVMVADAQIIISTVAGGSSQDGLPAIQGSRAPNGEFAIGPDGTVYFADYQWLWSITPDGIQHVIAGNGISGFSGDGPALSISLANPTSVVRDSQGNIYFQDNYRIRRLDSNGSVTTVAGNGLPASGVTDGPALSTPVANGQLAIDAAGAIYIAETGLCRVRRITPDGNIALFAGAAQQGGCTSDSGDGGPATLADLNNPQGIATDSNGNVYIGDRLGIRKVSPDGTISTIAGNAKQYAPAPTNGAAAASVSLAGLLGLSTDRTGAVYFSLVASKATGIYKVGPDGNLVLISSSVPFGYISLDQASNIYATSYSQLVKLTSGGTEVLSGQGTYSSPDGNQAMGAVLNATAVAVDGSGAVLFADSQCRVREIASDGSLRTIAGTGTCGTAMTGPAIAANLPPIRRIAGSGGSLYMLFGNGEVAWTDANGNLKATSSLNGQSGLAVDGSGNIYVTSSKYGVAKVTPDGTITSFFNGMSYAPTAIAMGPAGSLYVIESQSGNIGSALGLILSPAGVSTGSLSS